MRKSHETNRNKKAKQESRRSRDQPRRRRDEPRRSERRSGRRDRKTHRAGRRVREKREQRSPSWEPKKPISESPSLKKVNVCRHCDAIKKEFIQDGSTSHYCINLDCDRNDLKRIPMADLVDLHNYSTMQGKIENSEFKPITCSNSNILERTFEMDVDQVDNGA